MQVATLRDKGGKNEVVAACKCKAEDASPPSRTRLTGQPAKRYEVLPQGSRPWILKEPYPPPTHLTRDSECLKIRLEGPHGQPPTTIKPAD